MDINEVKMHHDGLEKHLCFMENIGYIQKNFDEYKKLVKSGKYICVTCGRVADKAENLCGPKRL